MVSPLFCNTLLIYKAPYFQNIIITKLVKKIRFKYKIFFYEQGKGEIERKKVQVDIFSLFV